MTQGIVSQYLIESIKPPQFRPQPTLDGLARNARAIYLDEYRLNRFNVQLAGLPQEHAAIILDAIAARANYCITNCQAWLDLSEETESRYALQIVSPGRFVELEG